MKALRLLRNIAALFIIAVALFGSQLGVGLARAASQKNVCYYPGKTGFNCNFDYSTGNCYETKCVAGQPCTDGSCAAAPNPKPPHCWFFCK